MCLRIHLPVFIDNFHGRQQVAPVDLDVQWSADSCKSCTWACQYTGTHRAFQAVHGSREQWCDKRGVNDTYIDRQPIIPRTGAVVMINVGLAQACPNYLAILCCGS